MSTATMLSGVMASAGAKVLVTGGYLVLERPHRGVVLSVDAHLHSSIFRLPGAAPALGTAVPVKVYTPQRTTAPLSITVAVTPNTPSGITLAGDLAANSFVATTLQHTLSALLAVIGEQAFAEKLGAGMAVHIRGDRSFYSSTPAASAPPSPVVSEDGVLCFGLEHEDPAEYATKTGLGSSAAVVASLVVALFAHFGLDASNHTASHRQMAYRLAQFAHCAAQGKVGSGFDVAAAFFGTHLYTRFSPPVIAHLLAATTEIPAVDLMAMLRADADSATAAASDNVWDDAADPFTLPPGLSLLLGDVQGGSETPSLVKAVLKWRSSGPAADAAWQAQGARNAAVERVLQELCALHSAEAGKGSYDEALHICSATTASEWAAAAETAAAGGSADVAAVIQKLADLASAFAAVRAGLRAMGEAAGVPIEPPAQTALLDETERVPGCVLAGVPGAGGYDAVVALVLSDSPAGKGGVERVWSTVQAPREGETASSAAVARLPVDLDGPGGVKVREVKRAFATVG